MKKNFALFLILFLGFSFSLQGQTPSAFTLEDIFKNNTFGMKFGPQFNVMKDGKSYSVLNQNKDGGWQIVRMDLETGNEIGNIVSSDGLSESFIPSGYEFSADEKFLLLTYANEQIYRHSFKSLAFVLEIATKKITKISDDKIMYPTLSPDNQKVGYVKENNLYIFDLSSSKTTTVTKDGLKNNIINGAVDWVYEEEFSMSKGFEWNSDGSQLAYYRFDESAVKEFSMDWWGGLYPEQEKWKYPKAGEDNSKVDIYIFSIAEQTARKCNTGSENDQYLPRIKWSEKPELLSVQRLNRKQNSWELLFFNTKETALNPNVVLKENSKTYVEISDNLFFIPKSSQFIYTSEKDGFNHIYCYDFDKKKEKQITTGNWDVTSISAIDFNKNTIYYNSSEISATEDHLYSIQFNGKSKQLLTPEAGNHIVNFGGGTLYYTDMHSNLSTPYKFTLKKAGSNWKRELESNNELIEKMKGYRFGPVSFGTMNTENGQSLNYYMMKPWNFDSTKKYPVFMHVYGGPGVNTVRNNYGGRNYLWHQYLTQQGYIVVSVDNRGTGNRGRDFKHSTYLQLGQLEHQDQTAAAKWLSQKSWVDAGRIGIWGWSFGGYMSSLCITKSADVFKTAIAVAPVTNWRYYDNIYTERFLQKPQDNPEGYDQNSPINFVSGIKGNYLLIHGTGDDNVHFQNTVEMINAMVKAGVNYDSEIYPNRNHGIGDRAAQYHLYKRMTNFVLEKL